MWLLVNSAISVKTVSKTPVAGLLMRKQILGDVLRMARTAGALGATNMKRNYGQLSICRLFLILICIYTEQLQTTANVYLCYLLIIRRR